MDLLPILFLSINASGNYTLQHRWLIPAKVLDDNLRWNFFEGIIYSTLIMTSEKTTSLIAKDFLPLNVKHP